MMLAGLFLMWGREAWHLTQLLIEPVYFVSGLNFPIARLGVLGSVAISILPLAVGSTRCASLPSRDRVPAGTPSPAVEALISSGWWSSSSPSAAGRLAILEHAPVTKGVSRFAAMTTDGLAAPEWGGFDPARTRGGGWPDVRRSFVTAVRLGWQMEANWTDPILFFIYSVAKPLAATLILVVMLDVISGGSRPDYRAFVVIGSALWSFVLAGMSGLAWMILDDRERYRMLKYIYVSRATSSR